MRVAPRLVGTCIALVLTAGTASAVQVAARPDAPRAQVRATAPEVPDTAPPTSTTPISAAPPSAEGPSAVAAPRAPRPPRSTTTTSAPRAAVPVLERDGLWMGDVSSGGARRIGGPCTTQGALAFTKDGATLHQLQVPLDVPVGTVAVHHLDGSSGQVASGIDLVVSAWGDAAAFVETTPTRLALTDSDLRSHRVEVPLPPDLSSIPSLALAPDGSAVAAVANDRWAIYRRDGQLLRPWGPLPTGTYGFAIGWTTDRQWVLLVVDDQTAIAVHPDGSDVHALDLPASAKVDASWDPAPVAMGPGSAFAVLDSGSTSRVLVADAGTGAVRTIASGEVFQVAWSPAGGPVLWTGHDPDGTSSIHATPAQGGPATRLAVGGLEPVRATASQTIQEHLLPRNVALSADGRSWAACS